MGFSQTIVFPLNNGGAKEARTPDLLNAIQTLYQLSYDPIHETKRQSKFFPPQVKAFSPAFPGAAGPRDFAL